MESFKEYLKEAPNFSPRPPLEDPAWPNMKPYDMTPDNPDDGVDVWEDDEYLWIWDGTGWVKRKQPKKPSTPLMPWEIKPTRYA